MNRSLIQRAQELLDGETGTVFKAHAGKLRVALAYPNTYYIGMSNVGFQAVYRFWNELSDVVCERVFLPENPERFRNSQTALFTLESQSPVRSFDVLAFSITFEPDELNVISMLDLAGVPALASERNERAPLVVAGGPITFLNPEPIAPFVDVIAVGEAEALLPRLMEALRSEPSRLALLRRLEESEGFYIPSHHDVRYQVDGSIAERVNRMSGENRVIRAKMGKRADLPPPRHLCSYPRDRDVDEVSGRSLPWLSNPVSVLLGGL